MYEEANAAEAINGAPRYCDVARSSRHGSRLRRLFGVVRREEEGTPARLPVASWRSLPIIMLFAAKWLRREPNQALIVLAMQAGAALAAIGAVVLLERRSRSDES
jgi:hypothetical protein